MYETKIKLETISEEVSNALEKIDLEVLKIQIHELEQLTLQEGFWNDNENAQTVSKSLSDKRKEVEQWEKIKKDVNELNEIFPTISVEEDPQSAEEFKELVSQLEKDWKKLEVKTFLNGKYDRSSCLISIHAGTGGKDAADFAEMLLRMYMRWAEKNEYSVEILDKSEGEEVGIKSATFNVVGEFAYGYLKGEKGVHRLVRNSPFNSKNSRETSFALVEIMPEIPLEHEANIRKDDLKIDAFRAGGAGGQNVNKVSSAVRITHIPTNIVVTCQSERSQHQNKDRAMKILLAKLADLAEKQQVKEMNDLKGERVEMSWGNQIRSYVLQPYKMVKDHRTDYEEGDVDAVLDGKIDGFIEAEMKAGF